MKRNGNNSVTEQTHAWEKVFTRNDPNKHVDKQEVCEDMRALSYNAEPHEIHVLPMKYVAYHETTWALCAVEVGSKLASSYVLDRLIREIRVGGCAGKQRQNLFTDNL